MKGRSLPLYRGRLCLRFLRSFDVIIVVVYIYAYFSLPPTPFRVVLVVAHLLTDSRHRFPSSSVAAAAFLLTIITLHIPLPLLLDV